jgi:hypothetical protein
MEEIPYGIKNIYNICVKRDINWYESTKEVQQKFWEDVNNKNYVLPEPKYKRQKQEKNECLITEE